MSTSTATEPVTDGVVARKSSKFQAGVRPYAANYYCPDYVPSDTDLLCAFRIEPTRGVDMIEAAAAVAAESSTGTWTEVWSNQLMDLDYYKAKAYRIDGDIAYIAYPMDLFEENSVVNIMSSIVGNVFGFKAVNALHLECLHYGQPILKPVYDHSTVALIRPEYVRPREFLIVEGLLGFSTPIMRQFYDVKVYLDPPEDMRRVWKFKRDTTTRGYTTEQVLAELERREGDSRDFIRPQRECADIVVRFFPPHHDSPQEAGPHLNVRLVLRPTIPHPDLTYLVDSRDNPPPGLRLQLGRDEGRSVDFLEIDGDVAAQHAADLEKAIWQHLLDLHPVGDDQLGAYRDRSELRHSAPLALTQLLIAYHLLRKYSDLTRLPFAVPVAALSRLESSVQEFAAKQDAGKNDPATENGSPTVSVATEIFCRGRPRWQQR